MLSLTQPDVMFRMDGPLDDFLVLEFNGLLGLDQLWTVALNTPTETVFKESMNLLISLYQKVNDTRQFNTVRKSFVDRSMEWLQKAHEQITAGESVANAQNQIDRLIFMLKVSSNHLHKVSQRFMSCLAEFPPRK